MPVTQQINALRPPFPPRTEGYTSAGGEYSQRVLACPTIPPAEFTSYTKARELHFSGATLGHPPPLDKASVPGASSYHYTAQEVVGAQQGAMDELEDAYLSIDTSLFGEALPLPMAPIAAMPNDPEACFMVPFWPQHVAEPSVGLGQDHYAWSATHGAHVIHADTSSTQEDLVNTVAVHPAVPSVQPSLQRIRAVERSGPFTEVICNERGEVLLVCPCGDTFSLQRGAVERHYDEKHAIDNTCPWRDRGCTSSAQDVKGHIRDKHCLTYFACPVCLRCDFGCERSMKKHSKACEKQKTGFAICAKCTAVCSSRAALAVHVGYCVSDWMMQQ